VKCRLADGQMAILIASIESRSSFTSLEPDRVICMVTTERSTEFQDVVSYVVVL
jgi:hypothetical protein